MKSADMLIQGLGFLLLSLAGCNLRQTDSPIYPLLQAAIYGRPEIVEMLIKSGCDINTRNESEETSLHLIAQTNSPKHVEVASILGKLHGSPH
jgi:ankyrin repeat protein